MPQFEASSERLNQLTELIDAERQCCPFLTFVLQMPAHKNALILEIKGPEGAKRLLRTELLVDLLGGVQVAVEETLEDSFCAELVDPAQRGMAFGVLATVNGVGDFLSSAMVAGSMSLRRGRRSIIAIVNILRSAADHKD